MKKGEIVLRKILVAGAGHGGLVAAATLAENWFDVTVIEKLNKDNIGHDWEDRFSFSILSDIIGKPVDEFPVDSWRYRGDCSFVSPSKRKRVDIFYNDENRQKVMWRKPLINLLIENAELKGVKFIWNTEITGVLLNNNIICGLKTIDNDYYGDLIIDSAGVFSPVRMNLPKSYNIEKEPKYGALFYAWRAYFDKTYNPDLKTPFEVYMYHECEKGLSWCCTNDNTVDILIGRIYKLTKEKIDEQLNIFRNDHNWIGNNIVNGGNYGIIPVRRPLTLMVGDNYAAVGDSAFMTMPMNGMGIDLSLNAGKLLSETIIKNREKYFSVSELWEYNREFHIKYGAFASKNEGLKNAILSIPSEGVDFLFENDVIQSSDLAGAGKNTNFKSLLGKLQRGVKEPKYFFALINGLIRGGAASKLYSNPPEIYNKDSVLKWSKAIVSKDIRITE